MRPAFNSSLLSLLELLSNFVMPRSLISFENTLDRIRILLFRIGDCLLSTGTSEQSTY